MGLAVAYLRPPVGGPIPEALVPEPAFEIFRVDTDVVGGRLVQVMPRPDFSFARRRGAGGDHAANTRGVPDEPQQSHGRFDAPRRDSADRAARAPGSRGVRRRGIRRIRRRDVHSGVARVSECDRRADVFEGLRPRRPAHRLPRRRARGAQSRARGDPGLQREHRRGGGGPGGARRSRLCGELPAADERIEGAAVRRLRAIGTEILEERRELRSRLRRRSADRAREGRGRSRHLHPRPIVRARLRRLPPHRHRASSSTHAAAIAAMEEVLCAAP